MQTKKTNFDKEYIKLLKTILEEGTWVEGRNGKTLTIPFYSFIVKDVSNQGHMTIRKQFTKGVIGEFKTFINPAPLTNVKQFEENGCNYWKLWADTKGEITLDYHDELVKQLPIIIDQIKKDPQSRRHVISLWNHDNVFNGKLSLPCCHILYIFSVIGDTIHLNWTNRSLDSYYGLPADVYLGKLLLEHVAKETGLKPGDLMFNASNVHLYEDAVKAAQELVDGKTPSYKPELKA